MKVEEIKCTGISYNKPANSVKPMIKTMVKLFKMRFSESEILESFSNGDYYPGRRFYDNDRVTAAITSGITKSAAKEYLGKDMFFQTSTEDDIILEGVIKSFVDSLSGSEMDKLIREGLRYCASADHWYEFEKEWA